MNKRLKTDLPIRKIFMTFLDDSKFSILTLGKISAKNIEAEGIHSRSDQVNPWRQLHVR